MDVTLLTSHPEMSPLNCDSLNMLFLRRHRTPVAPPPFSIQLASAERAKQQVCAGRWGPVATARLLTYQ